MSGFNDADSEQESQQKDNGACAALAVEEEAGCFLLGWFGERKAQEVRTNYILLLLLFWSKIVTENLILYSIHYMPLLSMFR